MNIQAKKFRSGAGRAAALMKCMANARRLIILCRLHEGESSVGGLEKLIGIRQSALSQHLAQLRRAGIVKTRRDAQTIYYSLADVKAGKIVEQLYSLFCQTSRHKEKPKKKKKEKEKEKKNEKRTEH